ncbi:tail protein X [Serratia marcescens]|jgi:phage tail protein X|uniref:tail protein X n=1 Tax=Serratia marcescens TaxID=615 RepID=UPI002237A35F|nr:tail protein X [Serratia marcescens]MCW6022976.1 tail protein X [Serratia marcescens]
MKVYAHQGDTVDALCQRYYGKTQDVTEQVLLNNPGLAGQGPILPHGYPVDMPDIVQSESVQTLQLWD